MSNGTAAAETSLAVPQKKASIEFPGDPSVTLPGIDARETKTFAHTEACTRMFIAALFVIARNVETARVSIGW